MRIIRITLSKLQTLNIFNKSHRNTTFTTVNPPGTTPYYKDVVAGIFLLHSTLILSVHVHLNSFLNIGMKFKNIILFLNKLVK